MIQTNFQYKIFLFDYKIVKKQILVSVILKAKA